MTFVLTLHSYTRWLVALAAVIVIVKFAWGWLKNQSYQKIDRALFSAFSGLLDLQTTLGLIVLLWGGLVDGLGFPANRVEHAVTMMIAVVLGHLPARWKKAADRLRFRNALFCVLGALVFIYLGVMRLRGAWVW